MRIPAPAPAIGGSSGVPDYYDRLRDVTVFEEQALYNGRNHSIDQNGTPTRVAWDAGDAVVLPAAARRAGARPHLLASRKASPATRRRRC